MTLSLPQRLAAPLLRGSLRILARLVPERLGRRAGTHDWFKVTSALGHPVGVKLQSRSRHLSVNQIDALLQLSFWVEPRCIQAALLLPDDVKRGFLAVLDLSRFKDPELHFSPWIGPKELCEDGCTLPKWLQAVMAYETHLLFQQRLTSCQP